MAKVDEQVIGMKMFIFPTPDHWEFLLSAPRVLEKRETSTAKARARDARANGETGF